MLISVQGSLDAPEDSGPPEQQPPEAGAEAEPTAGLTGASCVHRLQIPCQVLATLLHYFFLSAFAWMLAEGLHLYSMVVRVFGSEDSKHLYYYALGWGRWPGARAGAGRSGARCLCGQAERPRRSQAKLPRLLKLLQRPREARSDETRGFAGWL